MAIQSEAMLLLRPMAFFDLFQDSWLEHIYGLASYRETKTGEYLLREAEVGQEMFIMLEGELVIEFSLPKGKGKEIVAILKKGDLLGELSLLGFARRSASARATKNVSTLVWRRDDLIQLFAANPEIGYTFMSGLARSLATKLISTNLDYSAAFFHAVYKTI